MDTLTIAKPTSVSTVGGSATISNNGKITFDAVAYLYLDGLFDGSKTNHLIHLYAKLHSASYLVMQPRHSGSTITTQYFRGTLINTAVGSGNFTQSAINSSVAGVAYASTANQYVYSNIELSNWPSISPYSDYPYYNAESSNPEGAHKAMGYYGRFNLADGLAFHCSGQLLTGSVVVYSF